MEDQSSRPGGALTPRGLAGPYERSRRCQRTPHRSQNQPAHRGAAQFRIPHARRGDDGPGGRRAPADADLDRLRAGPEGRAAGKPPRPPIAVPATTPGASARRHEDSRTPAGRRSASGACIRCGRAARRGGSRAAATRLVSGCSDSSERSNPASSIATGGASPSGGARTADSLFDGLDQLRNGIAGREAARQLPNFGPVRAVLVVDVDV